jgi:hypothetical protein
MAQEWDIKPRSEECVACHRPFEERQPYFSALSWAAGAYARADYCGTCWPDRKPAGGASSFWQGVFRKPPPKPEEPLKKETAESLLRRLMETNDPARANVVYILAVMLERKRVLVERDVQVREDGVMVRVYEHRHTGETVVVTDPRLALHQVETVQREVALLLGGNAPAGEGAEPECLTSR